MTGDDNQGGNRARPADEIASDSKADVIAVLLVVAALFVGAVFWASG